MILFGTIVNIITVITGSLGGYFFHSKLPPKILKLIFQGIGLFTIFIGIDMASKTSNFIILVFSIILGAAFGEWIDIDKYINRFSLWIKRKIKSDNESFSEGMISAFLLFCMGSMTILGAFEEGTKGNSELLIAKSLMDGFGALALASALGLGVIFSIIPLFIFQGGLTLLSFWMGNLMPDAVINEMTATGGLMLTGLGLSIMDIKKIKIINLLPALVFSVILAFLFA
ncbi:MAG: DUF554 domain-containing protein [Prolixibacteraceae bacterium]|nr:DUF554 domain-containing protein [Prolixibacteraceae bacterium]MBN2649203.1 DUF554 domain-containing protein [Prolixibacteraceae bacterium]